ncbi:MAG: DNA polymerase IV [Candidatus Nanopelagicales bacterium]
MSRNQVRRPTGGSGVGGDDSGCTILHVDMDAFYALVELRSRPELRGKPVIVGGAGSRGVVLSATYEARAMGVHSAMPMGRARRLAPTAIIVAPQHSLYGEVSRSIMALFTSVTPFVEPLSLDEAFLDVGGSLRRLGTPREIGEMIRARIHDEQDITCSVGVASTKFVAKLASTRAKPDGLMVVPADEVLAFLHPLPVGALWGVGEKTEEQLTRLGLRTVADIANAPVANLQRTLGQAVGTHLHNLAWGRDTRSVTAHVPDRSISAEETFAEDIDDAATIHAHLLQLSDQVGTRLRKSGRHTRSVHLKVRFTDFSTITRSKTLRESTDVTQELYTVVKQLFDALGSQRARVRLVGVRVDGLQESQGSAQQLLLGETDHGRRDAEVAIDRLRARFGPDAVRPARLVDPAN